MQNISTDTALCVYYIGKFHLAVRSFDDSERCFIELLTHLDRRKESSAIVNKVMLRLGKVFELTSRIDEAERLYSCGLAEPSLDTARVHVRLGDLYFAQHSYEKSDSEYTKAASGLRSIDASPEDHAKVIHRHSLIYKEKSQYRDMHYALKQAAALLDSSQPSEKASKFKLSVKWFFRDFPEELYYEFERNLHGSNSELMRRSLIAFAEFHESGAKNALLTAINDDTLFPPDSQDRGILMICLAEQFNRMAATEEEVAWYLQAFDILVRLPNTSKYLVSIVGRMVLSDKNSDMVIPMKETIEAAFDYCQTDSDCYVRLLTDVGTNLEDLSEPERFARSVYLRKAYDIRKTVPSEVDQLNNAFEHLFNFYNRAETADEEEQLLLEHTNLLPTSGKAWVKLCYFYEEHGEKVKKRNATARRVTNYVEQHVTGCS